jgi:hypothetical protein
MVLEMAKAARTEDQRNGLKKEVETLVRKLGTTRGELAEKMAAMLTSPPGRKPTKEEKRRMRQRVYAWSKAASTPSSGDIAVLLEIEKEHDSTLNVNHRENEWMKYRPTAARSGAAAMKEIQGFRGLGLDASTSIRYALQCIANARYTIETASLLGLLRNYLGQKAAELERKEWVQKTMRPQILFFWCNARQAASWLSHPRMAHELEHLLQNYTPRADDLAPVVVGFVLGGDGFRSEITKAAATLETNLKAAIQHRKHPARESPRDVVLRKNLVRILTTLPENSAEPTNTLNIWVYADFGRPLSDWMATINIQDENKRALASDPAFQDDPFYWSTLAAEIPLSDAEAILDKQGIRRSDTVAETGYDTAFEPVPGANWTQIPTGV